MNAPRALLGVTLLVGGAVGARYAPAITRLGRRGPFGGTRRRTDARPAAWKTFSALAIGLIAVFVGVFVLVSAVV